MARREAAVIFAAADDAASGGDAASGDDDAASGGDDALAAFRAYLLDHDLSPSSAATYVRVARAWAGGRRRSPKGWQTHAALNPLDWLASHVDGRTPRGTVQTIRAAVV